MTETTEPVPEVGEALHHFWQFAVLPVGTEVIAGDGMVYRKTDDNTWIHTDGTPYGPGSQFALNGYNRVHSVPGETQPLTFAQHVWKIRSTLMIYASDHGVSDQLEEILDELGTGIELTPHGTGMRLNTEDELVRLPAGSTYEHGDPADPDSYGYWLVGASRHVQLIGNAPRSDKARLHLIEGEERRPAWMDEAPTDEDRRRIRVWMAKLYRAGQQLKEDQEWCGSYDRLVAGVGLTPDLLEAEQPEELGQVVTRDQARDLPVGTVLRWIRDEDGEHDEMWFVRDDTMENRSRTRLVMGHRESGGNLRDFAGRMTVVALPSEWADGLPGWQVEGVDARWLIDHAPVGTVFTYGREGTRWAVREGQTASPYLASGGPVRSRSFYARVPTTLLRIGEGDG